MSEYKIEVARIFPSSKPLSQDNSQAASYPPGAELSKAFTGLWTDCMGTVTPGDVVGSLENKPFGATSISAAKVQAHNLLANALAAGPDSLVVPSDSTPFYNPTPQNGHETISKLFYMSGEGLHEMRFTYNGEDCFVFAFVRFID
jgi:hypothetical protein